MIKNKAYFSKQLKLHYRHCRGGIIFEDKVTYTNEEIDLIKKSDIPVETIHFAKLYFDGSLITDEDLQKLTENANGGKSELQKAADYASKLLKDGTHKGYGAIHKASAQFNIAAQAIGAELGRRNKK